MSIEIEVRELANKINELVTSQEDDKQILILKERQQALAFDLLEDSSKKFIAIWNANLELLKQEEIRFHVSSEQAPRFQTTSPNLFGSISPKGKLVFESKITGFVLFKFLKHSYPNLYSGKIDAIGRAEIQIDKQNFHWSGRKVPKTYSGIISPTGDIKLKVERVERMFFGAGRIWKISGFPFSNNSEKRDLFLANRALLLQMAQDKIQKITAE